MVKMQDVARYARISTLFLGMGVIPQNRRPGCITRKILGEIVIKHMFPKPTKVVGSVAFCLHIVPYFPSI